MKADGFELGPVLVRDAGFSIDITYQPYNARGARRLVDVQTIHGRNLDCPAYLRGFDHLTGDVRTFRIDRIQTLHAHDGETSDNIDWILGNNVRRFHGLPISRPPEVWRLEAPVRLGVRWGRGRIHDRPATARRAAYGYRDAGWVLVLAYDFGGASHMAELGPAARGWRIASWRDPATGADVGDILAWLSQAPGRAPPAAEEYTSG